MPLVGEFVSGDIRLYVWEITETAEELSVLAGAALSAEAGSFASPSRRAEWLSVRLMLKKILGDEARIVYDAAGKPSLEGGSACISISHTRGYVALAVSPSSPVGLDIESAGRTVGDAARRFMRDEELAALPDAAKNRAKLLRWTASEAVYKLVGDLGGNYRDNIVMPLSPDAACGVLPLSLVGLERGNGDGYSVAYLFTESLLLTICRKGACSALRAV